MVRAIAWNLNRGQKDLRLYEIGKQYFGGGQQPVETWVLTLGATGQARAKNIEEVARPYGLADLKGAVEAVLSRFELGDVSWAPASEAPFFQPGRSAQVDAGPATRGVGGQRLGMLGQLAPQVAEALKLRQDVFLAQLNLQALFETPPRALRYQLLSRFPGVERDFSLILPDGTSFAAVMQAVRRLGINELVDIEAVDLFRGSQVPDGCFSLLLRLTFQSAEGTLTEEQINGYCERVVQALSAGLGAKIRR
jgi:phenylalanyl-tRNA synthetase beta chain